MKNHFQATVSVDDIASSLNNHGFAVIQDAIKPELLSTLRAELDPYFADLHQGHDDFMGHKTKRFGALLLKSTAVQDLMMHPMVLGAVDKVLLDYCVNYHIHYTGVMQLQPGEKAQVLHRDTGIFPFANPSPPLTVATMWALNDFTVENGGTILAPGSHTWHDDRVPTKDELQPTVMTAGSVLIYLGNNLHGGGANRSDDVRSGLAIPYGLGWLRQEENQYLAVPPDQARLLPQALQELLGYNLAAPSFGFVDHIHPRDYINGVRDVADSNVSSPELRKKTETLKRFHVNKTEVGRSRLYDIDD
jgi:ectoine hydroxylase-related dioxygenase (phytanoyl-CoA dioxygenase family)